jgi:hypothetical protein
VKIHLEIVENLLFTKQKKTRTPLTVNRNICRPNETWIKWIKRRAGKWAFERFLNEKVLQIRVLPLITVDK